MNMEILKFATFGLPYSRRVQISRGICTPEDRLHRFSRNAQATNWIKVTKKNLLVKTNFFFTFFLDRNLKVKNLN